MSGDESWRIYIIHSLTSLLSSKYWKFIKIRVYRIHSLTLQWIHRTIHQNQTLQNSFTNFVAFIMNLVSDSSSYIQFDSLNKKNPSWVYNKHWIWLISYMLILTELTYDLMYSKHESRSPISKYTLTQSNQITTNEFLKIAIPPNSERSQWFFSSMIYRMLVLRNVFRAGMWFPLWSWSLKRRFTLKA